MDLTRRDVGLFSPYAKEVRELYLRAFPEVERMPLWLLRLNALRPSAHLEAYLDGETFAGLTYSVRCDKGVYLLYLAVNDAVRSRGYGTRILDALKAEAGKSPLALDVEIPSDDAPNNEQRLRRIEFYRRSGITDTGVTLEEPATSYRVLSTRPDIDPAHVRVLLNRLSLGFYRPKIQTRARSEGRLLS
ncbi:MAG: GNAT family N-acetyltransferase [Olsenella sp.]|nr:GNAT family N-acetyltransferase [Olsenella sp.]